MKTVWEMLLGRTAILHWMHREDFYMSKGIGDMVNVRYFNTSLMWDPICESHVGDPHIDNHTELRGLTLQAGSKDPPSLIKAKRTQASRSSTSPLLAMIPYRIIKEMGQRPIPKTSILSSTW
ncbi:hypothetical protein DVH24_014621 [Malus domestica]|uniref:Uncharacterized protein n=1 Tax=Malus domestica TaxID=3750 RepID=A0A498KQS2_MALDO|nr:hypothetical protein DVH24_014621 [Malus domestica]